MKAERAGWFPAAMMIFAALPIAGQAAVPKHPLATVPAPAPRPGMADVRVAAALKLAQANDCKGALALLDPLMPSLPATGSGARFTAQLIRMPCLAAVGRGADLATALAEVKAVAPEHPLVRGFQIFVDVDAGRFAAAADGLAALADQRSTALALIPGDLWRGIAQQLTMAHDSERRDRVALALAQAEWTPSDHPEIAEALAADGVGTLLDRQDVDDARPMLARVIQPAALWDMAIERRYAPLWPDIEARLGPESGVAADRFARKALAAYAADPTDSTAIRDAVRGFLALGRLDDAESTAAAVDIKAGMNEAQVDAVLGQVQALSSGGDLQGALARLQPFTTLDLSQTPDGATAIIMLAETLDQAGRFQDELSVARTALTGKTNFYSPYGFAWLRRSETCALVALHRGAEATVSGDALKAHAADNEAASIEGLLCAGRKDEAAAIAVTAFATADGTDRIADQFQPSEAIFAHPPSRLRALWTGLLERKDVHSAFDRAARILPKPLWPSATPRAVPLLPGARDASSST